MGGERYIPVGPIPIPSIWVPAFGIVECGVGDEVRCLNHLTVFAVLPYDVLDNPTHSNIQIAVDPAIGLSLLLRGDPFLLARFRVALTVEVGVAVRPVE